MSWKLGKSKSKQSPGNSTLSIQDMDTSRSATPTPRNPDGSRPQFRSGILAIHVNRAEGLGLPVGVQIPPAVQTALATTKAQAVLSISPSSVTKQRLAKQRGHKDSVQRVGCWWLPYLVMEFEVNQIVLIPLGGDIKQPVFMYQATLWALTPPAIYPRLTCPTFVPAMFPGILRSPFNVTFVPRNRNVASMASQTTWVTIFSWVVFDLRPISTIWVHPKNSGTSYLAGAVKERSWLPSHINRAR